MCHAPIVLLHARDPEGQPIIRGRQVTGFTNEEEDAVGLTDIVPLLVENALKEGGAHYTKADVFAPYTRRDGQLITGQNPPSSEPTAKLLLEALSSSPQLG